MDRRRRPTRKLESVTLSRHGDWNSATAANLGPEESPRGLGRFPGVIHGWEGFVLPRPLKARDLGRPSSVKKWWGEPYVPA